MTTTGIPTKQEKLDEALKEINKRFGDGSIMTLDSKPVENVTSISTGSLALDLAIGVGGVPCGRSTEIFGEESSGKTTLMQHIVAEAQKQGGVAAYIDMENALDPSYAEKCGVAVDKMLLSQPDNGDQALEIAEGLIRSGAIALLVIDSIASLVPASEVEGGFSDATMGSQARLMSKSMRKLTPIIKRNNVAVVWTNQIRHKIGVMYGSPEYQPGGFAMKFGASVRIKVKRVNAETDEQHAHIAAKVVKNKVAPPYKIAEFDIDYAKGIDKISDILNVALYTKVVTPKGAWTYFEDGKWNGKEALLKEMRSNSELCAKIESKVRNG